MHNAPEHSLIDPPTFRRKNALTASGRRPARPWRRSAPLKSPVRQYALRSYLIKSGGFSLRGRVKFGSVYGGNAESRTKDTRPGPVRGGWMTITRLDPIDLTRLYHIHGMSHKGHYATSNVTAKGRASSLAHSFPKAGPRRDAQRLLPGPGQYGA